MAQAPKRKAEPSYGDNILIERIQQAAWALAHLIRPHSKDAIAELEKAVQLAVNAILTEKE